MRTLASTFPLWILLLSPALLLAADRGQPWKRHTIDNASRGADGVRLADVNGDGHLDIVTGWEEGSQIRVYQNPGPQKAKQLWPAATVGKVGAPEDAVFVDLDGDGAVDVVSSCEGSERSIFVHWAPPNRAQFLKASAWKTEPLPAARKKMRWMFALPLDVDGCHGVDLVAGAKNQAAHIGWFESPADPRKLSDWKWHPLYEAGWIMTLTSEDVDNDGDLDIVASDRKGKNRGCLWLEHPGKERSQGKWNVHRIGPQDKEVMFLVVRDLDQDGLKDVVVATRGEEILFLRQQAKPALSWQTHSITLPENTGTAKAVNVGDIDLDGKLDLVFSCENAQGEKSGVIWLAYRERVTEPVWTPHEISGPEGIKFDLVELIDLDADGDLDVLTCEERANLGVIWYENPAR